MNVCPFIGAGHRFEPAMESIRGMLRDRPEPSQGDAAGARTVIQRELKGVTDGHGGFRLDRFYWSMHTWNARGAVPFDAVTFHYSGATGHGDWFRFPSEPYLAALDELAHADRPEVLQYVVLRRLTFRARGADGATHIGKFKRSSMARGAFDVLAAVAAAAERQPLSFRVPAPLAYDQERHLFYQEALPGRPASTLLDTRTTETLLYEIGRVHAELHGLPVPDLAVADGREPIEALCRNCAWIGFFRPAERTRLAAVRRLVLNMLPRLGPAPLATCHGDFVCSHVLHGPDGWAVIDFDLARRSDPHADAALLISSLTEDVPLFHRAWRNARLPATGLLNRALAAYVDGYQSRARRALYRRRLLWYRIAAEIRSLALMFTKDRFHETAFERSLQLVEALASELAGARGGPA